MPRPRFERLSQEKRERILEAAAREFAAYGYEQASLNKILEAAQISKGAAYYYFDNKADLYTTTIRHYSDDLLTQLDIALPQLTADTFWPRIADFYWQQFASCYEQPWAFGAVKSAARLTPEALTGNPALLAYLEMLQQEMLALIARGQELVVIRSDLPDELLVALFMAVDDANDQWLLSHWDNFSLSELETIVRGVVKGMQQMLASPEEDVS